MGMETGGRSVDSNYDLDQCCTWVTLEHYSLQLFTGIQIISIDAMDYPALLHAALVKTVTIQTTLKRSKLRRRRRMMILKTEYSETSYFQNDLTAQ